MKKILLLGGSKQQVIAIEKAKELGYQTVLCDYLPDNPGQHVADVFYQVSTTDRDAVLEIARKEHIDGVLAYASDPAAPTAAYVAEVLGLPTNPLASVEILSKKHLFRQFLSEHGFASPKAISFMADSSADELFDLLEGFSWPVVIKPTDSSGSKGVSVVHSFDGLSAAIKIASECSRNNTLICEEYIECGYPAVIGGDIFVVDGEVVFWGLMDCLRDRLANGLVPVGEAMPCGIASPTMTRCKKELQRLVTALGLRCGELNVEIIVGPDDEPCFLELGARAGGNMIPVQLSDASGIDLVAANVRCAMGVDPGDLSWDTSRSASCYVHYVLHSQKAGIFAGVETSEAIAPYVYRTVLYKNPGDLINKLEGADKAVGIAFLRFGDLDQMPALLDTIDTHFFVRLREEIPAP